MKINEENYQGYKFIKLDNGVFKVTLCTLGASLYSLEFDNNEMMLTPKNLDDFIANNYYGKIVGRIANRVDSGKVKIGNKTYQMPVNEGENTLHSAEEGLNRANFSYIITSNHLETSVTFQYISYENKQSLPGDAYFKITYTLKENESNLRLNLKAKANDDTIIAMTNHMCFALGQPSIEKAKLQINASNFVFARRSNLLPLYEVPVVDCINFKKLKPIFNDAEHMFLQDHKSYGIDHHFSFDEVGIRLPNVVLVNGPYKLTIYTDYTGTQIYTCNYPDEIEKITGPNRRYEGISIEPQDSLVKRRIDKEFENNIIYSFSRA